MTKAHRSPEHLGSAVSHPDLATRHHRPSKLFEKDHAYAARLVQIAKAIRSAVRPTTTIDRVSSEIEGDDRITAGIVGQPPEHGSDP